MKRLRRPQERYLNSDVARAGLVLAFSVVILLSTLFMLPSRIPHLSAGGWIPGDSESVRVDQLLSEEFDRRATSHLILLESTEPALPLQSPEAQRDIARMTHLVRDVPGVTAVYTPLAAPTSAMRAALVANNERSWLMVVQVDGDLPATISRLPELRTAIESDIVDATVTGVPALSAAFGAQVKTDLLRAELIALPFALLCLIWFAGGFRPALAITLTTVTALATTLLAIAFASYVVTVSIFTLSTVAMLTIALSLDFGLLYALRRSDRHADRHIRTTVVIATIAIMVGMAGLIVLPVEAAKSIGVFGGLSAVVVLLSQRFLLPIWMEMIGTVRPHSAATRDQPSRWLAEIGKRPAASLLIGIAILIPLIAPITRLDISGPNLGDLPRGTSAATALQSINDGFPDVPTSPISIVARPVDGSMLSADNLYELQQTSRRISSLAGVQSVNTVWNLVPGGISSPILTASLALDPTLVEQAKPLLTDIGAVIEVNPAQDGGKLVELLRHQDGRLTHGKFRFVVGGADAANLDLLASVEEIAIPAIAIVALGIVVALAIAFRSVVLPIKAVLLNTLPVLAGLGMVTWLFQLGTPWTSGSETTIILIPMILAWLMFGVSMDYEVLMLARIRENRELGLSNREATLRGIDQARAIVSRGAVLMGIVFLSFATSDIMVVRAIGIGLLVAIVIDATVVRLVLLPASMILLGRWNWWWPKRAVVAQGRKPRLSPESVNLAELSGDRK